MKKYKIRTENFTALEWGILVEFIVNGYFFEDKYTPHFGLLNTMRIFFNECVEEVDGEKPERSETLDDIDRFINDREFIEAFNKAIDIDGDDFFYQLNFFQAYDTAMQIVSQRTNSWGELTNILSDTIQRLSDYAKDLASPENIELLQNLSNNISNGNITADSIVEAYGKTIKADA